MLASNLSSSRIHVRQAACFRPVRCAPIASRLSLKVLATAEVVAEPLQTDKSGVAHLSFQRGSVFKVRRVLDTIRGRSYEEALMLMEYLPYRACEPILKCLLSAAANAKHNKQASKTKLSVTEAYANQGPQMKRFRPRMQGRPFPRIKQTYHMTIKVEQKET